MEQLKICTKCSVSKTLDSFYLRPRTIKCRQSWCKECHLSYKRNLKAKYNWRLLRIPRYKFSDYRNESRRRKLVFNLDLNFFQELVLKPCFYCGIEPAENELNGIDRFDNSIGYVLDNCVPCCSDCNYSKRTRTSQEFIDHCQRIVNFQKTKTNPIKGVS